MTKRSNKTPYREGTWFAIPLRQTGFAVGRIARHSREGEILAYLFGPLRSVVPQLREIEELRPECALRIWHIGDVALRKGLWPIIGDSADWSREGWPVPDSKRSDVITRTAFRVVYSDDDPSRVIAEERIPYDTNGLDRDSLYSAGAAEVAISKVLTDATQSKDRNLSDESDPRLFTDKKMTQAVESNEKEVVRRRAAALPRRNEQAVILHYRLSNDRFGNAADAKAAAALEEELVRVTDSLGIGEFDGTETGQGETVFFLYGADADVLFDAIERAARQSEFKRGGIVVKRYGGPGNRETRVPV